jgi:hypothetical protein
MVLMQGDGNIRFYEMVENDNSVLYYLEEHKTSEPQRGLAFMPKRGVNVNEIEITRAYKLLNTAVEPISFKVPRKVRFQRKCL